MKLSKFFMIALLAGTLGVIGCGDDATNPAGSGGSGTAGTGGTPSNGSVCDDCPNQSEIPLCEGCLTECTDTNPNDEGCAVVALACCNII
jgi:hypothetical protein